MRVVLFGTGSPLSIAAFHELARADVLSGVVVPAARWPLTGARAPLVAAARAHRLPVAMMAGGDDGELAGWLARLEPGLLCVASFPHRLGPELLGAAPAGGLNVHFSLLPKHRGPDPLFWTYFGADAETGWSIHALDAGIDTGDVLAQERLPLARGRPARELYFDLASRSAAGLGRAVAAVAAGAAARTKQDEGSATREGPSRRGAFAIDWSAWGAERLWHFLKGLGGMRHDLLETPEGRPVPHGPATLLSLEAHGRTPGTIERAPGGWRVFARDGRVDVAKAPRAAVLRARIAAALGRRS